MNIIPSSMTIADYCAGMDRSEIRVNKDYQRSDKVWPLVAQSFLIETIILGFPIPKLSLYSITDLKTRVTTKEIVDGQQRSRAIHRFFKDGYALSNTLETDRLSGRRFSDLQESDQQRFVEYSLAIDNFVAATHDEIREVFRRMNSYTVPLNPEEQRHATFQGAFKWFAYHLSSELSEAFLKLGVFKQQQLIRMQDAKLITEIAYVYDSGLKTTKRPQLDSVYKTHDKEYRQVAIVGPAIADAVRVLLTMDEIHGTALMKPHIFYSLLLAMIHVANPWRSLEEDWPPNMNRGFDRSVATANLSKLNDALLDPDDSEYISFYKASAERTNVAEQRKIRFSMICEALTNRNF